MSNTGFFIESMDPMDYLAQVQRMKEIFKFKDTDWYLQYFFVIVVLIGYVGIVTSTQKGFCESLSRFDFSYLYVLKNLQKAFNSIGSVGLSCMTGGLRCLSNSMTFKF